MQRSLASYACHLPLRVWRQTGDGLGLSQAFAALGRPCELISLLLDAEQEHCWLLQLLSAPSSAATSLTWRMEVQCPKVWRVPTLPQSL